jgi:uncharacterized protein (DUF433 family)
MQIAEFTYIVADATICQGLPRIKDTRITVSSILAHIAGGMSISDILLAQRIQEIYIPLKAA